MNRETAGALPNKGRERWVAMRKTPRPFNQPTNVEKASALRRADKHRSDLYKSSILHYCPSLIGQIYLTRLRPQQTRAKRPKLRLAQASRTGVAAATLTATGGHETVDSNR